MKWYKILFMKMKYYKLKFWKNYLNYVKDESLYGDKIKLSIKDVTATQKTSNESLFQDLPEYTQIKEKYPIFQLGSESSDFDKAVLIMQWLSDNTFYSGAQMRLLPDDTMKILKFSVNRGFKHAINCRCKAIALTDLLMAHGIKAYPIALHDENMSNCHFVTHVFCSDTGKWAVFDPSFNCYFADEFRNVLDIYSLRELMLNGKKPQVIGYSFNGTSECKEIHIKYFIGQTLTNISTWKDNSNNGRHSKEFSSRKQFNCKLPE